MALISNRNSEDWEAKSDFDIYEMLLGSEQRKHYQDFFAAGSEAISCLIPLLLVLNGGQNDPPPGYLG